MSRVATSRFHSGYTPKIGNNATRLMKAKKIPVMRAQV
jgi:hypothetical protein